MEFAPEKDTPHGDGVLDDCDYAFPRNGIVTDFFWHDHECGDEVSIVIDPKKNRIRREGSGPAEQGKVTNARNELRRSGMGIFPDQANIESLTWLLQVKEDFEKAAVAAKAEYDATVLLMEWANLTPQSPKWINWYARFKKRLLSQHGIQITWTKDDEKKELFSELDFRLWKVLWKKHNGGWEKKEKKGVREPVTKNVMSDVQVYELAAKVGIDLSFMLDKQADGYYPTINEVSLMAYGSVDQQVHGDNPTTVMGKHGKQELVNPVVEKDKWYGSFMYVFENPTAHLTEGPLMLVQPEDTDSRIGLSSRGVQQKHCCVFVASKLHAGGVNHSPCIRMHVHVDPCYSSMIPQRTQGSIYISRNKSAQGNYQSKLCRKRKREEAVTKGNVRKVFLKLNNFYSSNHVDFNLLVPDLAEETDKKKKVRQNISDHGCVDIP